MAAAAEKPEDIAMAAAADMEVLATQLYPPDSEERRVMGSRSRKYVRDLHRPIPMPQGADPRDEMFYGT